eukprot:TRINITY_DN2113_c1_g1_i5.p1 TRINITY_DN2113_c1_g1~~TRINITY_DN2113_c1_g1_i5.p1  ORF type:complete len:360 (+),score=46.19 TRINITY_DN2113_c1_g1_i5:701-1780(+)
MHFSIDDWVYTIKPEDGEFSITLANYATIFDAGRDRKGLGLLEAPKELTSLDKTLNGMEALILTGSPERFQAGGIYKVSPPMTCLVLWTLAEAKFLVNCNVVSKDELKERFKTYGGVLRLLTINPEHAKGLIREVLEKITADFIERILTGVIPQNMNDFVYRIVELTADGKAKGFISETVFHMCKDSAADRNDFLNKTFIEKIENKGYLGCIFELKFRTYFAAGGTLQMDEKDIKLKKQGYETFNKSCVPEIGVLYQPDKSNFHGLDFFFFDENNVLYMLQTTVSETGHSLLKFSHNDVSGLLSRIENQNLSITSYAIIYVLPHKNKNFKVPRPECGKKLQKQVTSVMGWPAKALAGFE